MAYGLGIFENAKDVCIREKINGEYTLTFSLPATDDKAALLECENIIEAPTGQLFTIKEIVTNRNGAEVMLAVSCEHVFFNLLSEWHEEILLEGETATEAMQAALNISGIEHTLATVEPATTVDYIELTHTNPVEVINQIITQCGGELYRDNFAISLMNRVGQDNGVHFRYRKNLKSIQRTVQTRNLITRLIPLGEEDMDISTVNGGLIYLDSQYIGNYRRPMVTVVRWLEIYDEDELKAKALEHLAKYEIPEISYEVEIVSLKDLLEYGSMEEYEIGDDIRIYDEDLALDIKARIVEMTQYPYEPWRDNVVLANFRPGTETILSQLQSTQRAVETITTPDNRVNTFWLDGVINTLRNQVRASGAFAQAEVIEGKGILMENTNPSSPDYGAIYNGPGLLAIANTKDTEGAWNWRTFGTGKGFTADELVTGTVKGANGKWDLNNGIFRLGASDDNYQLKFDGTNLTFSDTVKIQFKGDTGATGSQGPQGPAGADGSYYAPPWIKSTYIDFSQVASPKIIANNAYLHDALSVGADGSNMAGISGVGTAASDIRFWAGASFANRASAPFRVTQAGQLTVTGNITLESVEGQDAGINLSGTKVSGKSSARTYYELGTARTSLAASRGGVLRCQTYLDGDNEKDCYMDITHNVIQAFQKPFAIQAGNKILLTANTLTSSHFTAMYGSSVNVDGNLSIGADYKTIAAPTDGAIIKGSVGIGYSDIGSYKLAVNGSGFFGGWCNSWGSSFADWGSSFPSNPAAGTFIYKQGKMYFYNGSVWKEITTN